MIEFFGTPLLGKIPYDAAKMNLGLLCGVSEARCAEIVDALMLAKKNSFVEAEHVIMADMEPVKGQHFNLGLLLQNAELDTETPGEILLVGMLVGRIYTELEAKADEAGKRVTKMVELFKSNPAKALRKMQKDIEKTLGAKR